MFGESHGKAADVWGLGLCLWEALLGSLPKTIRASVPTPDCEERPQPMKFETPASFSLEVRDLIRQVTEVRDTTVK